MADRKKERVQVVSQERLAEGIGFPHTGSSTESGTC